jgi:hypothetical protein
MYAFKQCAGYTGLIFTKHGTIQEFLRRSPAPDFAKSGKRCEKILKNCICALGTKRLAQHSFPRSPQFPNGFPRRFSTTNFTKICPGIWNPRVEVHLRMSEKYYCHSTNFDELRIRHFQTAFHENPTNSFVAHSMFHTDRRTWCRHETFLSSSTSATTLKVSIRRSDISADVSTERGSDRPLVRYCMPVTTPALATTTKGVSIG